MEQILSERIGNYTQTYTLYGQYRPMGMGAIISSFSVGKYGLHMVEPSGLVYV